MQKNNLSAEQQLNQGGFYMKKLFTLAAVVGLVVVAGFALGCDKLGGGGAKSDETAQTIMDLEDRVSTLEGDVEALSTALSDLQTEYDNHMEKYHGTKVETKPLPQVGGGGHVKPPTSR
jgi:outer membrane murein-binding lipoprotein Lpp